MVVSNEFVFFKISNQNIFDSLAGAIGTGATGGFGNFGSNHQGQLIADYIVQPGGSGGQGEYQ